jgi:4'-phosphopantetheinyl transferase
MLADDSPNGEASRIVRSSGGITTGWAEVWIDRLDLPEIAVESLTRFLTAAELALCDRCRLPQVRQRKIVARAKLRQILSRYLDQSPQEIEISVGSQGKPQVAGLEFNLSHSGDLVAYAVSDRPVGIDIECVRSIDLSGIIQRFFTPSEFAAWQKLPPADREIAFFQTWTIKEAYLKAIGTGLHTPLSEVEVSIDQDPPIILQAPNRKNWQLRPIPTESPSQTITNGGASSSTTKIPVETSESIDLPPGYVGALITAASVNNIEFIKPT